MTRHPNAKRLTGRQELAEARARLVASLRMVDPAMQAEAAQAVLERAGAWSPIRARELDQHLTRNPDAFTSPSPQCPAVLVRLLRELDAAGYGATVTMLACMVCGRTDIALPRLGPTGRCCYPCAARTIRKRCVRCGQDGRICANRHDGPICGRCYRRDPEFVQECTKCGRLRPPAQRAEDGTAMCQNCYPRPEQQCIRCRQFRPVDANTEEGPVCRRCHKPPGRLCGLCGRIGPIHVRATGEQPDICTSCYRGQVAECSVCRRLRSGFPYRGGAFHCSSCRPRIVRQCADCGQERPTNISGWPVGALCPSCHSRRTRNPVPCSQCDSTRIAVGRTPEGDDLCGPCCDRPDMDVSCRRCGYPGDIYADGCCTRCVATIRATDLLCRDNARLQPLVDALAAAPRPLSVITWLEHSASAKLLADLATQHAQITHELLDGLPQQPDLRHVRETLVTTGLLPPRHEVLAQVEIWVNDFTAGLPGHHARIIRPFADWHVLRDARRRATRGRYTTGAASGDRQDIRTAATFLTWLEDRHLDLSTLDQVNLDLWLTSHPTRRNSIGSFIRWALARHLAGDLVLPPRASTHAAQFLDEEEHYGQLRRCLNDDALPLDVRIVGALVRLYGLQISRITILVTDRFHTNDGGDSYLTIDRHPVLLPPKLARLIQTKINNPGRASMLSQPDGGGPRYLLPGRPANRPLNTEWVRRRMNKHGLPNISARNTAMVEAVAELPPTIISDLFGVSTTSAHKWAHFAQDSWADYMAACKPDEQEQPFETHWRQDGRG
jgi:hypothetical protein